MRLSPAWAAEYRGFWDLPGAFGSEVATPTVAAARAEAGRLSPEESAASYLASSEVSGGPPPGGGGQTLEPATLADLLDEKLPRRSVKDIQSSFKDPDRFDKWVALLSERVPWDDPIVLPAGEGLNIVRRAADGALGIRCDCGHDLCAHDRNWKMDAVVFVRDSNELMREV